MNGFVIAGTLAAAVASTASAGFTGWSVEVGAADANGNANYSVFLNVTNDFQYVFLNCFDYENRGGTMGAQHNDMFTDPDGGVFGTWSPAGTTAGLNAGDSYVTASGNYGGGLTGTALDPSFNDGVGDGLAFHSGWYDASPGSANNISMTTLKHKVAQIRRNVNLGNHDFWLRLGYKKANTTVALFGDGVITLVGVPAPGAIALLGLAGLTARRRRA